MSTLEFMLNEKYISREFYNWLNDNGFKTAPASTKYHGAFEGGLFAHSENVTEELCNLTEKLNLTWQRVQSPYIVGMFHDLCKIDLYLGDEENGYYLNPEPIIKGHGEKSVMLLSQFMTLTNEEMLCIRYHMGAYEKADWEGFDLAIKKYPNVLFTHTADMIASKLRD